ncbi:metallocarboxypeptidase inhibitor-like [Lycium barbarum]|uniref:metallocarboxypeptidase inhibitor-like n=1 Tax=Lycium barbarum TaxID=112863 RepID=UPI00293F0A75|nr:metallocarboxypeptidase inhibitor-like [Lycium barbarum]
MAGKCLSHKFAILFTALLVVIASHSFYSTKIHVMAQEDVVQIATKLFQDDPTCGKPCNTMDDCSNGWFCQACWNSRKTCGPFVGDAIAMGM